MKIDSHQHFWSTKRDNDYGFLTPDAGVLYREYLPNDIKPIISSLGINYTIAVQAAQSVDETRWLLHKVEHVNFVLGVVGWLDLDTDPDRFIRDFHSLKAQPKLIGLRPMIQDIEDDRWILRKNVIANLKFIEGEKFPFDLLVYPKHLPYVYEMLQEVPRLHAVIDHLAKPKIIEGEVAEWSEWIEKISQHPNLYCKLSGMVTEADHENWKKSDFIPYVDKVLRCFGSDRVMFGSDWPVCRLAAEYDEVYQLLRGILQELGMENHEERIFGKNAISFYNINMDKFK